MSTLYNDVRTSENLFAAWRHVKRSALKSTNGDIRGQASEFEHQHQRHLRRIQTQLRENRFSFDGVEGVLKDKKKREAIGKSPRPITIGTIKNRIVQRAILQVLQPRRVVDPSNPNSKFVAQKDSRLGILNDVNCSKYGVGGLMAPYGGVRPAIVLVMNAMQAGDSHYFQSDIKAFFTAIPTEHVVKTVFDETGDERLTSLFSEGLVVHLANKEELAGYAQLFPSDGIGVAQGSSLSAFAGNVLLFQLDHQLNNMGVSAVRYIDDIFMLGRSEEELNLAIDHCSNTLSDYGFSLYSPVPGSDKASKGLCKDGFNFLGCAIQPNRCVPSKSSTKGTFSDINDRLSNSKKAISQLVKGAENFDPKMARSAVLDRIGRKVFGWQKSFAFCTDQQPFRAFDEKVADAVHNYDAIISRLISNTPAITRMRALGIPSTEQMFLAERNKLN